MIRPRRLWVVTFLRQDLILYLEFKGVESQAEAWRKTSAYRLLSETKLGGMLEDIAIQAIETYQDTIARKTRIKGVDAIEFLKRVATNGFAVALCGKPPQGLRPVIILHKGDQPEYKAVLQALAESRRGENDEKNELISFEKAGRTLRRLGGSHVWWVEKGTLIISEHKEVDEVLSVLAGEQPSAVDHPRFAELLKAQDGFEPLAAGFLDAKMLQPLSPELAQLGLGSVKGLEFKWGFDGDALIGTLRIAAPAPRTGALRDT